LARWAKKNY